MSFDTDSSISFYVSALPLYGRNSSDLQYVVNS